MKDKDQVAIFESYREDILNKFKQSLEGDKREESPIEPEISDEVPEIEDKEEISSEDMDDSDLGSDVEEVDDMEEDEKIELPKKNVIVRSQEISVDIGPKLREIV